MFSGRRAGLGERRVLIGLLILFGLSLLAFVPAERVPLLVFVALGAMVAGFALRAGAGRWRGGTLALRRPRIGRSRQAVDAGFHAVPVALLRLGADGSVQDANPAARQLIGRLTGPLPAMHEICEDLGRPVSDWIAEVAAGRHPGGTEVLRLRGAEAEAENFVQLTLQPFGDGAVMAVMQDATAMKRLEVQFTQSQKMQAIGQLAGGVAHDFNNLLTAISGHCELLLLRHRPDDLDHPDLIQIQQNAYRAAALVRQLLAFSRKQTLVPERVDLADVLGELTHLLKRLLGGAVLLELRHAPEPVAIRADKRQFEQVIMNLAVNARDAMPSGGVLGITTDLVELGEPMLRDRVTVPAGRYAMIRISDTGTGMSPETIGKIFEPFFTTKRAGEGTGLGLSTVYGIVKQSGGYIFVESEPGSGTEFQLWFPALAVPAPMAAAAPPARQKQGAVDGVVLLVEDEAPVRAFAARALRMRGLTVLEAATGEEALTIMENVDLAVDILISDLVLPGLDGPAWVGQALQRKPGLPVIFMSGYASDTPSQSQGRVANSVFLSKPFTLVELGDLVTARLKGAQVQMSDALSVS